MKKLLVILCICVLFCGCSKQDNTITNSSSEDIVFEIEPWLQDK